MMKISTEIGSASRIVGNERAVALYGEAGFDAWDFSMFNVMKYNWQSGQVAVSDHPLAGNAYLRHARELRAIGEDHNMFCNQSHAPFPIHAPQIRSYMKRAIEITAEAGGRICVIHPDNNKTPEENAQFYLELLPFAKEHGVKIATENMWNWDAERDISLVAACSESENFCRHIDLVNDPWFVACLDIGHAEMKGSGSGALNMIRALGSRLQALHIHDNDLWHDCHQIPFSMQIDFVAVMRALKEIGYCGELTLEADSYLKAYNGENILDGMKNMVACAKKLAQIFDTEEN